jgi:deazaflavin-dependent oxidoreductase (nitroreductase family)
MPMPLWWGQINKRVFNPRALRSGKWQAIHHVGRSSGRPYRTPLEAMRVDDGYIIMLVYGQRSDWVRNVLAAGSARLEIDGETVEVANPEIIAADEAFRRLPPDAKRPPSVLRIGEFLALRRTDQPPGPTSAGESRAVPDD